jgi:hypothetical protein
MIKFYYFTLLFLSFSMLSAQVKLTKEEKARREKNIKAGNPFVKYGCKAPVATLSKGKYLEVHDLDSIVIIGSTRWQVDKKIIVGEIKIDSLNADAQPLGDAAGIWMSPDPLIEEYPNWSPYSYTMDNPINLIDPDGKEPTDWYLNKDNGKVAWRDGHSQITGYENLGHTWGRTDLNGNRTLLDGDTKKITYNGIVKADFNNKVSGLIIKSGYTIWGTDRSGDTTGLKGITKDSMESDQIPAIGGTASPAGETTVLGNFISIIKNFLDGISYSNNVKDRVNKIVITTKQAIKEAKEEKSTKPEYIYTHKDKKNPSSNVQVLKEVPQTKHKNKG